MRRAFADSLIALYKREPFIFLTGDLGFMALEPLRTIMGERFINCGVAEQNMVGMAAGMAKTGESVWVYSIAPFLYARAFEQIRNDVCFHNLPVKLVGNGGGYHYGVMGPTHWALEDYGTMLALPNMKCFVPAFADDIAPVIERMHMRKQPSYLRLGRCEKPKELALPEYASLRQIGDGDVSIITIGAIAGSLYRGFEPFKNKTPKIWLHSELPLDNYASPTDDAIIVEEHVQQGGLASMYRRQGLSAQHFPAGHYGSQQFMREKAGLTADHIMAALYG